MPNNALPSMDGSAKQCIFTAAKKAKSTAANVHDGDGILKEFSPPPTPGSGGSDQDSETVGAASLLQADRKAREKKRG